MAKLTWPKIYAPHHFSKGRFESGDTCPQMEIFFTFMNTMDSLALHSLVIDFFLQHSYLVQST